MGAPHDILPKHLDADDVPTSGAVAFGTYGVKKGPTSEAAPADQLPGYKTAASAHLARHKQLVKDCASMVPTVKKDLFE
jgi:hypothetical protein